VPSQKTSFTLSARFERSSRSCRRMDRPSVVPAPRPPIRSCPCGSPRASSPPGPAQARRDQHSRAHAHLTARMIAASVRASAPKGTRTSTEPATISMQDAASAPAGLGCTQRGLPAQKQRQPLRQIRRPAGAQAAMTRPSLAALIQFDSCCGIRSYCRATSATTAPGATACATTRPFSSAVQRRRRTTPLRKLRPFRAIFAFLHLVSKHNDAHLATQGQVTRLTRISSYVAAGGKGNPL